MNVLLSLLQKSTDYNQLLKAVEAKQAVAVSGLSQAPRSHVCRRARAVRQTPRRRVPGRYGREAAGFLSWGAFLGEEPPVLPSRELTLAGAIGVSRQWEQQRLRLFVRAGAGTRPGAGGKSGRAAAAHAPRQTLFSASVTPGSVRNTVCRS